MIYQHGLAVVIYGLSLTEIILNTIIQSTIVIFVNHQLPSCTSESTCINTLIPEGCCFILKCVIFNCIVAVTFMSISSPIARRWMVLDPGNE